MPVCLANKYLTNFNLIAALGFSFLRGGNMWHLTNVFSATTSSSFIIVLMAFFATFESLQGIELPLELLHHEAVNGGGKSMDFARRMAFPLTATNDNGVEMPPSIEDNMDLNDSGEDIMDNGNGMPKWLQMQIQQQPEQQQQHNNYHHQHLSSSKHKPSSFKHHSSASLASASPLKRCNIEISQKIPGICQVMGSIGTACVSGDYIDVFNAQCL